MLVIQHFLALIETPLVNVASLDARPTVIAGMLPER